MIEFDGILPLDKRSNLPAVSGIYFVLDREDIIYVGKSNNIKNRWRSHHRLSEVKDVRNPRIAWIVTDQSIIDKRESEYIDLLNPKLNNLKTAKSNEWGTLRMTLVLPLSMHQWLAAHDMPAAEYLRRLIDADMNRHA